MQRTVVWKAPGPRTALDGASEGEEVLPTFAEPYVVVTNPGFMGWSVAETINQAAWIYAARSFAVGLDFFLAAYLCSAPMLFILIFVRFVTDLIDLPTFLVFITRILDASSGSSSSSTTSRLS